MTNTNTNAPASLITAVAHNLLTQPGYTMKDHRFLVEQLGDFFVDCDSFDDGDESGDLTLNLNKLRREFDLEEEWDETSIRAFLSSDSFARTLSDSFARTLSDSFARTLSETGESPDTIDVLGLITEAPIDRQQAHPQRSARTLHHSVQRGRFTTAFSEDASPQRTHRRCEQRKGDRQGQRIGWP